MKIALYVSGVGLSAATAFGQGTMMLNNDVPGVVVCHVYDLNPQAALQYGNGPADYPPGTTDWTGWPLLSGSEYTAQLWAAPGLNQVESSLQPAFPTTTFQTGAGAGFVVPVTETLAGIPADSTGGVTFMLRVWDNQGGTVTSWAQAIFCHCHLGESALINFTATTGGLSHDPPNLVGLQSFQLGFVPEPSTWALLVLGSALLAVWRLRFR